MKKKGRLVHLSFVHNPRDVRIFYKECISLHKAGYDVHLITSKGSSENCQGVALHAIDLQRGNSRFLYYSTLIYRVFRKALALQGDVYHLHEAILLPVGFLLRIFGKKVVFDVHENFPHQAISLNRDRPLWGRLLYFAWSLLLMGARWWIDYFVLAEPALARGFPKKNTVLVQNFPKREKYSFIEKSHASSQKYEERPRNIIYVGGIFATRGIWEILDAIEEIPESILEEFTLIGPTRPSELKEKLEKHRGWKKVNYLGWQRQEEMIPHLFNSRVGLVILHPLPTYMTSLPTKLLEYMMAGLPVVATNLPWMVHIIEKWKCGLLVDPYEVKGLKKALCFLLENEGEAAEMGHRGKRAVEVEYNWKTEEEKLLRFYREKLRV